jgi:hypothetical protein
MKKYDEVKLMDLSYGKNVKYGSTKPLHANTTYSVNCLSKTNQLKSSQLRKLSNS